MYIMCTKVVCSYHSKDNQCETSSIHWEAAGESVMQQPSSTLSGLHIGNDLRRVNVL